MRRRKSSKSWVVHPSEDQPVQEPAVTTQKCSVGTRQARPSVAIVGSGIAGNAAAYYLRGDYDVTIFEAASRAGGHAYTMDVDDAAADLGFQVYNLSNYPQLQQLFDELGVLTIASDMSLSASIVRAGSSAPFEWSSTSPFPSISSLLSPERWRLFSSILSFEREAKAWLRGAKGMGPAADTVLAWLDARGYSTAFRRLYFYPMVASIWSAPTDGVDDFSMHAVLLFLDNHFMLERARPKWRTLKHRSRDYVARIHALLPPGSVRLGEQVHSLRQVEWQDGDGKALTQLLGEGGVALAGGQTFDFVVLACSAEEASSVMRSSALLDKAAAESAISALGHFSSADNQIVVHSDVGAGMPRDPACWAAWNYISSDKGAAGSAAVTVTYYLNKLQSICGPAGREHVCVTLNPPAGAIDASKIWHSETLVHPLLSSDSVNIGRPALEAAQGACGLYFAGAWTGAGFHEDGVASAASVARKLGAPVALPPQPPSPTMHRLSRQLAVPLLVRGLSSVIKCGTVRLVLPDGSETVFGDGARCGPTGGVSRPCSFGDANNGAWAGCEEVCVRLLHERALWRLLADPGMGFAEAYIAGELMCLPDITDFFRTALWNTATPPVEVEGEEAAAFDSPMAASALGGLSVGKLWNRALHQLRPNSLSGGSELNVSAHYDLCNGMFEAFLDPTMTYSSCLLTDQQATAPPASAADEAALLKEGQLRKLDAMIAKAGIGSADRVLEIGVGWGSCVLRAAETVGFEEWVGLTLSVEQLNEAQARVDAAGIGSRVKLLLLDYREVTNRFGKGYFDRVVSIEMIEAVGRQFLPTYFGSIASALKPGGTAALQAICVADSRYDSYSRGSDFIRKHIFPGSHLPCPGAINQLAAAAGLTVDHGVTTSLGLSYAKTLAIWRRRFAAALPQIHKLQAAASVAEKADGGVASSGGAFDDAFARKFDYYFAYCEAGFAARHIETLQIRLTAPAPSANEGGSSTAPTSKVVGGGQLYDSEDPAGSGAAGPSTPLGWVVAVWHAILALLYGAFAVLCALVTPPESGYTARLNQRMRHLAHTALDAGVMPDALVRVGIRKFCQQKLNELSAEGPGIEAQQRRLQAFAEELRTMPIAVHTQAANEQHYEVSAAFYDICLGPRRKYSCCKFPEGARAEDAAELLPQAEIDSLDEVMERAEMADGMAILDLGCGWGSGALHYASKLRDACLVGVSNSHSQRVHIMSDAQRRGLTNIDIVTIDVSKGPIAPRARAALTRLVAAHKAGRALGPESDEASAAAAGGAEAESELLFDRVVSLEMFEHMKNYEVLLGNVAACLRSGGKLFVHIFVHDTSPYHFIAKSEADWMARYFFAGGMMPSADLLFYFQDHLKLRKHWRVNGRHYQLTSEAWLQRMTARKEEVMEILKETYPAGETRMWWARWRAFYLACAELWGFNGGSVWYVGHYLFEKP